MSRNTSIFVIIIVVALGLGGIYWYLSGTGSESTPVTMDNEDANQANETGNNETSTQGGTENKEVTVTYTDSGYSPKTLTVKVGTAVTFKNESSGNMWTASAMHPTHIVYSGTALKDHCPDTANTSFDGCRAGPPGSSWSFTFNKVGEWGYHNHVDASMFGKIIVEQ